MHLRPVQPSDLSAIARILEQRRSREGRSPLSEHKAIRVGDAASLELVAVGLEGIVGYGHAAHHAAPSGEGHWAIEVVVALDAADPELVVGSLVLGLRRRIPDDAVVTMWGWRSEDVAVAGARGWPQVRRLRQMTVPLPVSGGRTTPEGVEIRTFVRGADEEAWLAANNVAFADHPENGAVDRANLEARLRQPWFDPAGFLLAWEGDELLGFCWTKLHPGAVGEIYIIGVVPAAQGRGLGAALLHAGLADLAHRQGAKEGMLYVAARDDRALALYEQLGFSVSFTNREFAVSASF